MRKTRCQLAGCGRTVADHHELEEQGRINHKFTSTGDLEPIERNRPGGVRSYNQRSSGRVQAGVSGDPVLRYILVEKGIITIEDLENAERVLKATGALVSRAPRADEDDSD